MHVEAAIDKKLVNYVTLEMFKELATALAQDSKALVQAACTSTQSSVLCSIETAFTKLTDLFNMKMLDSRRDMEKQLADPRNSLAPVEADGDSSAAPLVALLTQLDENSAVCTSDASLATATNKLENSSRFGECPPLPADDSRLLDRHDQCSDEMLDSLLESTVRHFNDRVPDYGGAQFVRLVGLKKASMNNFIGTVSCYNQTSGRFGVILRGETTLIALKPENLVAYSPDLDDICGKCTAPINLFSLPECSCFESSPANRTSSCSSEQLA